MIAYFSCTGNSRRVAELLAVRLGERLAPISLCCPGQAINLAEGERLIFVFPIHSWGLPKGLAEALAHLPVSGTPGYCCMVATCGDDCGLAAHQWRKVMLGRGFSADAAFSVQMPNTYVLFPGFDVDKKDVEARKLAAMPVAVDGIARQIAASAKGDFSRHGVAAWLKSRMVYPWFMKDLDDSKFRATEVCTGCGRCAKSCPLGNITIDNRRPRWHGNCINCLACYHNCPRHAVAYGKRTSGKGQYVCPQK